MPGTETRHFLYRKLRQHHELAYPTPLACARAITVRMWRRGRGFQLQWIQQLQFVEQQQFLQHDVSQTQRVQLFKRLRRAVQNCCTSAGVVPPIRDSQLHRGRHVCSDHQLQLCQAVFVNSQLQLLAMRPKYFFAVWTSASLLGIHLALGNVALAQTPSPPKESPFGAMAPNPPEALVRDPYAHAEKMGTASPAMVARCRQESLTLPIATGNSAADFRCKLVAFEVCMFKEGKVQSQSQDSANQCQVIRGLAGPTACQKTCEEASALKKGGSNTIVFRAFRFTGLTDFAAACWREKLERLQIDVSKDSCAVSNTMECLINASDTPSVNETIALQRRAMCQSLSQNDLAHQCGSCNGDRPRIDYNQKRDELTIADPNALLDAISRPTDSAAKRREKAQQIDSLNRNQCNPALAAQGHCKLP